MRARLPTTTMLSLAWRNLWRNRERSLIMMGSLALAVGAMIFLIAMMRGLIGDMQAQTIKTLPGDIQIHHPQFREDPSIEFTITPPSDKVMQLLNSNEIEAWSSRIKIGGMAMSERATRGIELIGYDPSSEGDNAFNNLKLIEGRWLRDANDVIVGKRLLEKLETDVGKRIVIITQGLENDSTEIGLRIVGSFTAETAQQEETQIYIAKSKAQSWLQLGDKIHEIAIYTRQDSLTASVQQKLLAVIDTLEIKRWDELNPYLSAMLKSSDAMITVIIVIIFATLSFGLVNTLVMAIFERTKEIGLMLALGLKPMHITKLILTEMLILLTVGVTAGNLVAGSFLYSLKDGIDLSQFAEGFAMIGVSPLLLPIFTWNDLILCNSIVVTLGLLSSTLPAWRASHKKPIEALNND